MFSFACRAMEVACGRRTPPLEQSRDVKNPLYPEREKGVPFPCVKRSVKRSTAGVTVKQSGSNSSAPGLGSA
jgi:hypothetical protein